MHEDGKYHYGASTVAAPHLGPLFGIIAEGSGALPDFPSKPATPEEHEEWLQALRANGYTVQVVSIAEPTERSFMNTRIRKMEGTANFYPFAYLRQAAWNAFETAQSVSEGSNFHRISAVLFSVLTIEAHLNHVAELTISDWNTIERTLSWGDKFARVSQELNLPIDKSRRPVQTVIQVFRFRDKLVHGKTHSEDLKYKYREGRSSREDELDPDWLRQYWSDDAVKRVLDDVEQVLECFHTAAGLEKHTLTLIGDGAFAEAET